MSKREYDGWFLGVDLGTGSCKTTIVDEKANVLGFGVGEYSGNQVHERWQEQEPGAILEGMIKSVRTAIDQSGRLRGRCFGLAIGGALHSLMAIDSSGNPITGIMTWADGRAAQQAQAVRSSSLADELYQQTGCPVHGMYPLYKIMWLREERPEIYQRTSRFLSAKEFVVSRLTGQYVVDYCLAAGSGLLNTHNLMWNSSSMELAGITPEQLSSVQDPRYVFQGINPIYAKKMGISSDTPLVLGSADAVNSNLGAGAVNSWQATLMIGTSGALRYISPQPVLDPKIRSWCYAIDNGHWLVGGAINNGGIALSWLKDTINQAFSQFSSKPKLSFEDLIELAEQAEVGSGGLICLPYFAGERSPHWNLNARAVFLGMTLNHDIRHLSRALLEGIAFQFMNIHAGLVELGCDIRQIRASGGFTRSNLWLQIMASALNQELLVPEWGETSSLGSAFWAMLAEGTFLSLEKIADLITVKRKYNPNPKEVGIYKQTLEIYNMVYEQLSDSFNQIATIQDKRLQTQGVMFDKNRKSPG